MSEGIGNDTQIRAIVEQISKAVLVQFALEHPEITRVKAEIPAPLKLVGTIAAAVLTAGAVAVAFWVVTSVNTMQVTLARMDERQVIQASNQEAWKSDVTRRLDKLESTLNKSGGSYAEAD